VWFFVLTVGGTHPQPPTHPRRRAFRKSPRMASGIVTAYLRGEPLSELDQQRRRAPCVWYGSSLMRGSNTVVKELCAASDDGYKKTMWDHDRKLWGTIRLENVVSLISSGLWAPNGMPPSMKNDVLVEAKRMIDAKQKLGDNRAIQIVEDIDTTRHEYQDGPEAKTIALMVERSKAVPRRRLPYARQCSSCGVKPLEQFLECGCNDETNRQWELCGRCHCIWHKDKMRCLCTADAGAS